MTAKEYCSRPRMLEEEMNRKLDQAERLRLLVTQTGQVFRKVSVTSTRRMDRMQEAMNEAMDLEQEAQELLIDKLDAEREVLQALQFLPENQARVLRLHYLEGLSFQAVSARMLLDLRWIRRLHERGLACLEERMGFDPPLTLR